MAIQLTASNALTTFNFNSNEIRVVTIDDQPWFVIGDVCEALGFAQHPSGGYQNQIRNIAKEDKQVFTRTTLQTSGWSKLPARSTYITEGGLYNLVMRSDKPEARDFQYWVTHVVLPAIRKDGAYIMGEEKVASGEMDEDEFVLKAMAILQRKVERLKQENEQQAQVIVEMKPKIIHRYYS